MTRFLFVLAAASASLTACGESITEPIVPDAVVLPAADTIVWGEKTRLTATYLVAGAVLPSDGGLRWRSSQPQFFRIDSLTGEGEAFETVVEPGAYPVLVIAESHGVADTMTVILVPSIYRLVMTLSSAVALGRTFRPVIQALDGVRQRDFTPPPESGTPALRSSNPAVVSVGTDGRLTALAAGDAWVTATLQGASDSALVRVGPGYPISLIPRTGGLSAHDVNNAGQVVTFGDRFSAFNGWALFDGDTTISLGECSPRAINNAGAVACGNGRVYSGGTLGPLPPGGALSAVDITEAGLVFGMRKLVLPPNSPDTFEPVVWDGTGVTPLPALTCCGPLRSIVAVNALGHLVGSSLRVPEGGALLVRGVEGRVLDLPRVEWATPGFYPTSAAINDAGDVVGQGPKLRAVGTAAVWLAAEQWKGRFLGLRTSWATGIAENGLVVGQGLDGAFVWRSDRYALLQDLVAEDGWTIRGPAAISRGGMIVASVTHTSGKGGLVRIRATSAP